MKKFFFFSMIMFCFSFIVSAQSIPAKEKKRISQNEVPAKVLQAFVRDFQAEGGLQAKGTWMIHYSEVNSGDNVHELGLTPLSYSFRLKTKGKDDIKVNYAPDGTVMFASELARLKKAEKDGRIEMMN